MDKKDIYEHLANIYFDASSKKTRKIKLHPYTFRNMFFVSAALVIGLSTALYFSFDNKQLFSSEVSLALTNAPLKINFNFDPAKKEIYALNLNGLNLARYKSLGFSLKNERFGENITLKVEFTDAFNETAEVYVRDLGHKWQDYRLSLRQFKQISNWTQMSKLKFIVEEWNAQGKSGIVYIDNVKVFK